MSFLVLNKGCKKHFDYTNPWLKKLSKVSIFIIFELFVEIITIPSAFAPDIQGDLLIDISNSFKYRS